MNRKFNRIHKVAILLLLFPKRIGFGNVAFGGGKPEYLEKNSGAKMRTDNKLNPHMASLPGFEPGPRWWEASALTTAPSLLPSIKAYKSIMGTLRPFCDDV